MTGSDNWPNQPEEPIDPVRERLMLYRVLAERVTKGYDGGDLYDLSHAIETMRLLISDLEWMDQEHQAKRKWWKLWLR